MHAKIKASDTHFQSGQSRQRHLVEFSDYSNFNESVNVADSDAISNGLIVRPIGVRPCTFAQEDRDVFAPKTNYDPIRSTDSGDPLDGIDSRSTCRLPAPNGGNAGGSKPSSNSCWSTGACCIIGYGC